MRYYPEDKTANVPHTIYGVAIDRRSDFIYIGCTSNFENRKQAHGHYHPVLKLLRNRLSWKPLLEVEDRRSGKAFETAIATRLKNLGQCQLNFSPSIGSAFIPESSPWATAKNATSPWRKSPQAAKRIASELLKATKARAK